MATGLEYTYSNAARMLDCIQTITKYQQYLNKGEHDIDDPETLARLIMRRVLKENYVGFNIRKNLNDYALKCEDKNLYTVLYAAKHISSNTALMNRFAPSVRTKVDTLRPVSTMLDNLRTNFGIQCSFREGEKFFIHVNFLPLLGHSYYDEANFNSYSMVRRIEHLINAVRGVSSVKFDPIFEPIMKMIEENSIYHIYEKNLVKEIDEDFLDFYMKVPTVERRGKIRDIYKNYHKMLQAKAREALKEENPEAPMLVVETKAPEQPTLVLRGEPQEVTEVAPGLRLREVTEPVEDTTVIEDFAEDDAEGVDVETVATDLADILEERVALRPRTGLRRTEAARPLQGIRIVPRGEFELEIVEEEPAVEDGAAETLFVNGEGLSLYLRHLTEDVDTGLQFTETDLFDDDDADKDGLYFTTIDGNLTYLIFDNSNEIGRRADYSEARVLFLEHFGREPEMVKYCRLPESTEFVERHAEPDDERAPEHHRVEEELPF